MAARSSYLRVASVRCEISSQLGPYALVPTIVIAEAPGSCPRGQFESHFGPLRPPHAPALPLLTQLSPAEGSLRAAEPLLVNRWPSEARVEELSVDWTEVGKPSPANGGWPTNPPFCHKVRPSKRRVARNPPFEPCPAWQLGPPPDECTHRVLPPVQIQCS